MLVPVLEPEEFIRRLKIASARLGLSGALNIYLDAGELFAGHWIEIRVGAGGEVRQIALAG